MPRPSPRALFRLTCLACFIGVSSLGLVSCSDDDAPGEPDPGPAEEADPAAALPAGATEEERAQARLDARFPKHGGRDRHPAPHPRPA